MPARALNGLIESLVQSIERDAAAISQRHALRRVLQGLASEARAEDAARIRRDTLGLAGLDGRGCGEQCPQQACGQECRTGVDHPVGDAAYAVWQ